MKISAKILEACEKTSKTYRFRHFSLLKPLLSILALTLIVLSGFQYPSVAAESKKLCLGNGSTYMLFFDDSISNVINTNEKALRVDVITTIFSDKQQVLLTLIENTDSKFSIVTAKNTYNYEVCTNCDEDMLKAGQPDVTIQGQLGELILDLPPVSSLEVSGLVLDLPPSVVR